MSMIFFLDGWIQVHFMFGINQGTIIFLKISKYYLQQILKKLLLLLVLQQQYYQVHTYKKFMLDVGSFKTDEMRVARPFPYEIMLYLLVSY